MDPQTAVELLRSLRPELERRYGVVELALFGSLARGDGGEDSDVDVLVGFDGPATSAQYFGRPVDLVTDVALRPELRPYVEEDAKRV